MTSLRSWAAYPATYRAAEIETLAGWMRAGVSGSVVGLTGAGKSNLFGFLAHRPDVLESYLSPKPGRVMPVLVDLNDLPTHDQATLYRIILYAFYEARHHFEPPLQEQIVAIYQENRTQLDPFLPYTALRDLLTNLRHQQLHIVLMMDHFDNFCRHVEAPMLDTLRGLRDSFKDSLFYLVGLRREIALLPNPPILGELRELLDRHVCWVGGVNEADARFIITQQIQTSPRQPTEAEIDHLLRITGRYPSLLKSICHWWLARPTIMPPSEWLPNLLVDPGMRHRLGEIWGSLTETEQQVLTEVNKAQRLQAKGSTAHLYRSVLDRLVSMGLCTHNRDAWQIRSELLSAYIVQAELDNPHKIWLDETNNELYQGQTLLTDLSPLAREMLRFLVNHPRQRHTKTDLIINAWPDDLRRQGVTDDSLYQVVKELRKKIEPDPGDPRYLITWRGRPEGGYQFFSESIGRAL